MGIQTSLGISTHPSGREIEKIPFWCNSLACDTASRTMNITKIALQSLMTFIAYP